ncbi:MAG: hypothetical protein MSC46_00970, partial [Campylobacter sp.]|nr:hypothetical protein [Campylobacter sp.]
GYDRLYCWRIKSRIPCVIASKAKQSLGILNSSLGNSRIYLRNSRIPYYVILGLDPRISIWNSRIFVIAREQSDRSNLIIKP